MYSSKDFQQLDNETFRLEIPSDRPYKILQLTDLHLGLTKLSKKKDYMALRAVSQIIRRAQPDLIIFTGDQIFPYLPKAGTLDNGLQARRFIRFMDRFQIPYTMVFGNHDTEMGAKCSREELAEIFASGKYSFFTKGCPDIFGVGNFIVKLVNHSKEDSLQQDANHKKQKNIQGILTNDCNKDNDSDNNEVFNKSAKHVFRDENEMNETHAPVRYALALLDSNMYGDGWFYSGFDCIHDDQADWCMKRLNDIKEENPDLQALAFFHMPPAEIKEAYAKMKLGGHEVNGNKSPNDAALYETREPGDHDVNGNKSPNEAALYETREPGDHDVNGDKSPNADIEVTYKLGSVGEKDCYFGISHREGHFFEKAKEQGSIKGMFFGHDHLNTLSLEYQGIRLTYGMSIDYLGYKDIEKYHSQRGGTLIAINPDNSFDVSLVPLESVVSPRVRGKR